MNGKYVKVSRGSHNMLMPLEEYLDEQAMRYGYDSYEQLKSDGCSIGIPSTLYDAEGNPIV